MEAVRSLIDSTPMAATILIADDYEDNLEVLRLMLVAADYEICEARDGQECVLMAKERLPDLIMVDLSMPVLDGWAVFRELKADAKTAGIPCIAVTAHGDTNRDRALQNGFNGYLSKPFSGAELLDTVAGLLAQPPAKAYSAETLAPLEVIGDS